MVDFTNFPGTDRENVEITLPKMEREPDMLVTVIASSKRKVVAVC